jgi:hypothetical protein
MGSCERHCVGEIFRGSITYAENFIAWLDCEKCFLSIHAAMPRS